MRDAWPLLVVLGAIAAGCLLDRMPMRAFYSRRAFEPPVRTYAELEAEVGPPSYYLEDGGSRYHEDGMPLRGEVHRLGPAGRGLPHPGGRELERWE